MRNTLCKLFFIDIDYTPHWNWLNKLSQEVKANTDETTRKANRLKVLKELRESKGNSETTEQTGTLDRLNDLFKMDW